MPVLLYLFPNFISPDGLTKKAEKEKNADSA